VVLSATSALAGATYPPPTHKQTVPPGPPTAFTGAEISTPVKIMIGLVIVGVLAVVGSLIFTKSEA
jgi:hypothetical protein